MLRWIATALLGMLFALNLALPSTSIGRRGTEAATRFEVESAKVRVGHRVPDLELQNLDGSALDLAAFRGHRILLTFERSVDW